MSHEQLRRELPEVQPSARARRKAKSRVHERNQERVLLVQRIRAVPLPGLFEEAARNGREVVREMRMIGTLSAYIGAVPLVIAAFAVAVVVMKELK